MNKNKWTSAILFLLASSVMAFGAVHAADSAYGSSTVTPTIYSKNYWYNATYPVVGSPPANATLTAVYYRWDYPYPRPAGLLVYLCNNAATLCADVSSAGSGMVNFSGYGVPANQSLKLFVRVNGTGTMSPLYGSQTSVTVNYTY